MGGRGGRQKEGKWRKGPGDVQMQIRSRGAWSPKVHRAVKILKGHSPGATADSRAAPRPARTWGPEEQDARAALQTHLREKVRMRDWLDDGKLELLADLGRVVRKVSVSKIASGSNLLRARAAGHQFRRRGTTRQNAPHQANRRPPNSCWEQSQILRVGPMVGPFPPRAAHPAS